MRRTILATGLCAALFTTSAARAAGNEAAAQALFDEAKKLAAQGKYAEACPKFAESNRLDRGAGTLIHLGDCYEKNKQTASAWATYTEAASAAQALGRKDWEKLASQRAAAIEPKLAKLTIKVASPSDKLEVSRDGTSIAHAAWGVPIPVDTGTHVIEAAAPGFKPFKTSVSVSKDGESVVVDVPKLETDASAAAPTVTPAPTAEPERPADQPAVAAPPENDGRGQRTIGLVVGGVGAAGLVVGAITGLMAMSKSSDAKATCPSDGTCASRDAVDASESAKSLGLVSTIAFIAGGVGAAAGAALYFTAPGPTKTGTRIAPTIGGLTVTGAF